MTASRNLARPAIRRLRNLLAWLAAMRRGEAEALGNYWADPDQPGWKENSHWREASLDDWTDGWSEVGTNHLAMYERFVRAYELPKPHRTLEWGVGGGANAIRFAPISGEFIAVDVAQQSLDETVRQVGSECASSVTPVLVSTSTHYAEVTDWAGSVDLFLCFYVLELVPTEAHAYEIIDVAHRLLKPGGAAILQAKYRSSAPGLRPWAHLAARLGNMCIIDIPRFWAQLESTGFIVRYVELVPRTRLDRNYAYFFATKPE